MLRHITGLLEMAVCCAKPPYATDGTKGKSQFKEGVDVDSIVEDAWKNGKPQITPKGGFIGKVKQYEDEIGTQGEKSVDVRFSRKHGIHGFPSNKVE